MAILKIETITWLQDNPADLGGTFVAGDVVETFFDTTLLTFSVKLNGQSYTGSAQIVSIFFGDSEFFAWPGGPSFRTRTLVTPNYCIGTTLYQFWQGTGDLFHWDATFPYSSFSTVANANQCAIVPVVPDIAFQGNPEIAHASTTSSFDGSISYQADSSYNPIAYILSVNGYYFFATNVNDATHNQTGIFTGLGVGHYEIIAIDEHGFEARFGFDIVDLSTNHPVPPIVICDLLFPGNPTINQDTGSGNGSITFGATSTYSIEYALRDFTYGDGLGQGSSTFSGLVHGQYKLYARDLKNCRAEYIFTIPNNTSPSTPPADTPSNGILYKASWRDLNGVPVVVNIVQKGYSGATTEVTCAGEPMRYALRLEGKDDPYSPIGASELTLFLMSLTPEFFNGLFTTNPDQYQMHYLKNGELKWMGKIFPATFSYPFHQNGGTPYPVNIKATDGLMELDSIPFVDDGGNRFIGKAKQITVIARALNKLKFGIGIRTICNIYADGMNTTSTDDPLDQSYVDYLSYYQETEPLSCLEVIKRNIEPYGATIIQWFGYWWIVRREELVDSPTFREFDKNGVYKSNGAIYVTVEMKNGIRWAKMDATVDMVLPKGYIEIDYSQGLTQLVPNSDFAPVKVFGGSTIDLTGYVFSNSGDPYSQTGLTSIDGAEDNVGVRLSGTGIGYLQTITKSALKMYAADQLKIGLRYKVETYLGSYRYQKIKIQVQYGTYFLRADGTWDVFTRTIGDGNKIVIYETDFGKFKDWEVTAPNILLTVITLSGSSGTATITIGAATYLVTYSTNLTVTALNFLNTNGATIYAAHGLITNVDSGTIVFSTADNSVLPGISIANTSGTLNGTKSTADSSSGYGLTVTYFSSWSLDAEFTSYVGLRTKTTVSLTPGYKSEIKLGVNMLYYELENNLSAESTPSIVRPNDYNVTTNPYQWILKQSSAHTNIFGLPSSSYGNIVFDKVVQEYLPGGNELSDLLIINKAPKNSKQVFQKTIYHGSLRNTNTTLFQWGIDLGSGKATFSGTQVGNPNAKLTFINYLRSSTGEGWVNWTRDAVSELLPLEQILANSYIAQLKDSSRRITGSLTNNKQISNITLQPLYITPLSFLTIDGGIFLPMGFSYMDKSNIFNGEFIELLDITDGGTETDGGIKTGNTTTNSTFG